MRLSKHYIIPIFLLCLSYDGLAADETFWEQTASAPGFPITSMALNPCGELIIGTTKGLYRSSDEGNSWALFEAIGRRDIRSVLIARSGVMLVGRRETVYRSYNCGESWQQFDTNSIPRVDYYEMAEAPDGTLYAVTGKSPVYPGHFLETYISLDTGRSWELYCMPPGGGSP